MLYRPAFQIIYLIPCKLFHKLFYRIILSLNNSGICVTGIDTFFAHCTFHAVRDHSKLRMTVNRPGGQVLRHRPHPVHLTDLNKICGSNNCDSGLPHHLHLRRQPFKNTVVRIPGPSSVEHLSILNTLTYNATSVLLMTSFCADSPREVKSAL